MARVLVAAAVVGIAGATMECSEQCRPWVWADPSIRESMPCEVKKNMDFRVLLGDTESEEELDIVGDVTAEVRDPYWTYFYCPEVDKFTSLKIANSHSLLAEHFAKGNMTGYISIYGGGKSYEVRAPVRGMDTRVKVWDSYHTQCNGPAIADFLIYNVTLKSGDYRYKDNDPIGNGFMNTCDESGKTCQFDSSSFCIGEDNKWNCASCARDAKDTKTNKDIDVMVSWYGTDSAGDHLLSGSSNPLNFRQFAIGNVYSDIKGDVTGISWPVDL